jgi:hypothetical protein
LPTQVKPRADIASNAVLKPESSSLLFSLLLPKCALPRAPYFVKLRRTRPPGLSERRSLGDITEAHGTKRSSMLSTLKTITRSIPMLVTLMNMLSSLMRVLLPRRVNGFRSSSDWGLSPLLDIFLTPPLLLTLLPILPPLRRTNPRVGLVESTGVEKELVRKLQTMEATVPVLVCNCRFSVSV